MTTHSSLHIPHHHHHHLFHRKSPSAESPFFETILAEPITRGTQLNQTAASTSTTSRALSSSSMVFHLSSIAAPSSHPPSQNQNQEREKRGTRQHSRSSSSNSIDRSRGRGIDNFRAAAVGLNPCYAALDAREEAHLKRIYHGVPSPSLSSQHQSTSKVQRADARAAGHESIKHTKSRSEGEAGTSDHQQRIEGDPPAPPSRSRAPSPGASAPVPAPAPTEHVHSIPGRSPSATRNAWREEEDGVVDGSEVTNRTPVASLVRADARPLLKTATTTTREETRDTTTAAPATDNHDDDDDKDVEDDIVSFVDSLRHLMPHIGRERNMASSNSSSRASSSNRGRSRTNKDPDANRNANHSAPPGLKHIRAKSSVSRFREVWV